MSKPFVSLFQKIQFPGIGIILASLSCFTHCHQCAIVKLVPDISKQLLLIYRGIYIGIFCIPVIIHGGHYYFPRKLGQCLIIFTIGSIGTLSILFLYKSLDFLPLIDATVLTKTDLIFTAILGFLILREKVHFIDVIAITLSFTGIILITRPSFVFERWDGNVDAQFRIRGSFLAVGCGFCVSLTHIMVRRMTSLHYAVIIFYYSLIQTLIFYSYQFIVNETIFLECGTVNWIILAIAILSFSSQYFYIWALSVENANCVVLVYSLEIVFSFIFQVTVTGEDITLLSVLGALFITLAIIIKACLQWYSEIPEYFFKALNKICLGCLKSRKVASTQHPL